jgi:hypothetical protein
MSETARLAEIFISFYRTEELPHDIIQLIFGLLLEIDTVIEFEAVYSDDHPSSVNWGGKYTNGSIYGTETKISFNGAFESTVLKFCTILPALILSIEYGSMNAHAFIGVRLMELLGSNVLDYVKSHRKDKHMVILKDSVVLDSDKIDSILRELKWVWELIKGKGLTYNNDVLCKGNNPVIASSHQIFQIPMKNKVFYRNLKNLVVTCNIKTETNEALSFKIDAITSYDKTINVIITVYKIDWKGIYTSGCIMSENISIGFHESHNIDIKGMLPALIISIQYCSTNGCFLDFPDKKYWGLDAVNHLRNVLGDFITDSNKVLSVLQELTLVWEKCRKAGITYKNNRLCMV